MSFAGLTFLAPLALLGLMTLPLVWWLLRVSPPRPRQQVFPPLEILRGVQAEEETPAGTPLWLLLFRLALVALVAVALAKPILQSVAGETKQRPTLVIDQSVFAAPHWNDMIDAAEDITKQAQRDNLDVRLITADDETTAFRPAADVLERLKSLQPLNYPVALPQDFDTSVASDIYVLSAGLALAETPIEDADLFVPEVITTLLPGEVRETPQGFDADWYRPSARGPASASIDALGANGAVIASSEITFSLGAELATARFALPAQLRSRVARLRVAGVRAAASVKLLDDSFGRPLVAVLRASADTASPLLSEPFYAQQALAPFADVFEGDEAALLALQPSLIVMPDAQRSDSDAIRAWVEAGGILVRFAGPRLAERPDSLLPVALRSGGRAIGGALAWEEPQRLAPFAADSPFSGLAVPDDVTVSKQVMAEPGIETDTRSWARLEDGSPIVTSAPIGSGRVILFHVTAGPDWSNLALSGLYVDMLRRILPLAKGRPATPSESAADWRLDRELDAFGRLRTPTPGLSALADTAFADTSAAADTPAGYYRQGTRQRALPVLRDPSEVVEVTAGSGANIRNYGETSEASLTGKLLGFALAALALDALLALFASGRLAYLRPNRTVIALMLAGLFVLPLAAQAQDDDTRLLEAATGLHLAFIETGDTRRDSLSRTAMEGLSEQLNARTTIEPAGVHGVAPDAPGLEMYPFLYWSVRRDTPELTPAARVRLNAYMAAGGTIVFDTGDEGDRALRAGAPHPGLQRVTEGLDIPRLAEVPDDHVLNKSFYLTRGIFPGRWANGPVYVQANSAASGGRDGVSPVIIGSNDWAAGWAVTNEDGAIVDLERDISRQRELSIRFGVNVAMYALSGNYKADQVHAAALVERLGSPEPQIPGAVRERR